MNNSLPVLELKLDEEDIDSTGLIAISLVKSPAIEIPFLMFSKEKLNFSVGDNERRIITGAVLVPNQLIYRVKPYPCNVMFREDQIEEIVQRFFKTGNSNKVTLEHALHIEGAEMLNLFVSDKEMGITPPKGFEALPDKTLFASYKITNDELWSSIKDGSFTGFSLEGFFNMFPVKMTKQPNDLEIFNELQELFSSL